MLHLPPLAAEVVFRLGSFPVTNTLVNAVLVSLLLIVLALILRGRLAEVPHGLQNLVEAVVEELLRYFDQVTQDRAKSVRFLPIVGTLFLFIVTSNWLGVFPGIGSIGRTVVEHGEPEFIPLFRSANTDFNLTLAMAVLAVVGSHILGVVAIGFWKYSDRFVKIATVWRSFRRGGVSIMVAVIEFFVGLIEVVSEIAKMISLSLRLFGNIFAGEVLLTVMASLVAWFVPLPFILLELLVGIIQATVFAMLTLVYLTMATVDHGEHGAETE